MCLFALDEPYCAFEQSEPEHFLYSDSAKPPPQYSVLSPEQCMRQLPRTPAWGNLAESTVLPQKHLRDVAVSCCFVYGGCCKKGGRLTEIRIRGRHRYTPRKS